MDAGKKELERLSVPPHSFTISSFPLPLFSLITLEPDEKAILTSVEVKFDNPADVTLGFTNALTSPLSIADLLKDAASTSRKVSANWSELIDYPANKDEIYDLLINPLDATLRAAKSNMAGQDFLISESGILGRKKEGEAFADEQMILQNNCLLFTNDGWQTLKTALGKVVVGEENGNPVTAYGLVADVIVGNLLVGQNLAIKNSNSTVLIDGNGIEIKNGEDTVFKADTNGNASLKGEIKATSGNIGGFLIEDTILKNKDNTLGLSGGGDYLIWAGAEKTDGTGENITPKYETAKFSVTSGGKVKAIDGEFEGKVTATSGTFTGTVEADAGYIGGFAIENNSLKTLNFLLSADAIQEDNSKFTSTLNFYNAEGLISTKINEQGIEANSATLINETINGGMLTFINSDGVSQLALSKNEIRGNDTKIIMSAYKGSPTGIKYTYYPHFTFEIISDPSMFWDKTYRIGVGFYKQPSGKGGVQYLQNAKVVYLRMEKGTNVGTGAIIEDTITIEKGKYGKAYDTKNWIENPKISFDKKTWYSLDQSVNGQIPSFEQVGEPDKPDERIIAIEGNILPADTLDAENEADPARMSKYNLGTKTSVWNKIRCFQVENVNMPTALSDKRFKNSIEPIDCRYLQLLHKLKPVKYKLNDDMSNVIHTGFIAQDVKKAMDECGISPEEFALYDNSSDEGYLRLCYDELIAVCVFEIQELRKEIESTNQK